MPGDLTIAKWVDAVPTRQWRREDDALDEIGDAIPPLFADSRPLAEVHRLDLSLFVVFEEVSLRACGVLTRRAPSLEALNFCAQQTLDEARHHEVFRRRLERSRALAGEPVTAAPEAILTPPLRRFLERCYEVIDGGAFVDGMVLVNLVLEGMAYPLYAYEERYWAPVDPYLARLVRSAFTDETRHVHLGARIVRELLDADATARERARRLCGEARTALAEIFQYYIRTFVSLFDAVAKRHSDLFAGAEFAPGQKIAETPYKEQVAQIQASIEREHGRLLARAGLC